MISLTPMSPPPTRLHWPRLRPRYTWAWWQHQYTTRWERLTIWLLIMLRESSSRILTQTWPCIQTREIEADRRNLQNILRDFLLRRLFIKVGFWQLDINCQDLSSNWSLFAGYACALIGDILLQGHLYVTDNYLGFHSNVFGYITRVRRELFNGFDVHHYNCLDSNSFDFCDLDNKGKDSQNNPQCSGGVHRGWDPHLHFPDLKGRHLQGHDQGLEESCDQE